MEQQSDLQSGSPQAGFVEIKLTRAIKVSGTDVTALRMREPTVADQYASDKLVADAADKELTLIANLCMVTPDELKQLTLRDYKKAQKAFLGFLD